MSFDSLGLSDALLRALHEQGYDQPTPIQAQAIPFILEGRDVMASAQTGTGKTAGFTLPMLEILNESRPSGKRPLRALILSPTRELAAQIGENVSAYGRHLDLKSATVFGGVSINPQADKLRRGVDILVATPGRLLDHAGQGNIDLSTVSYFVLDEADRMLDMGFIHDIKRVFKLLPQKSERQNLLFSATFSKDIQRLAGDLLNSNPAMVDVAPKNSTAERVEQLVYPVDKGRKKDLLASLIVDNDWGQVLVFTRTKHGANRLVQQLMKHDITAAAIHGNKSQGARTKALANFKSHDIQVLVATDIAARGLDIAQLPHVVNYELPNVPEDYVHRIGRTARAGHSGVAVSLVCGEERKLLKDIERLLKRDIPKTIVEGFEPSAADANEPLIDKSFRGRGSNGPARGNGGRGGNNQGGRPEQRVGRSSGQGRRQSSGGQGRRAAS